MVIGDLNLTSINWSTGTSENVLETEFLNGFAELGLVQYIDAATHNKGNILDVLLTKSKQYISDIKIIDTERFCISDHYAISFNISHKVYRKPRTKRTCYNYKNARWENLNNDLNTINWDSLLDFQEPEAAWKNFKNILSQKIEMLQNSLSNLNNNPLGSTLTVTLNAKKRISYTRCIKRRKQ